jgi:hypothetical protein
MRKPVRRAHSIVAVTAAILVLMAFVAPATASSLKQVTIVSNVTFNPDGPNYGDFTATGKAADSGLICNHGTFVDTFLWISDREYPDGLVRLIVRKAFTCDDGSGTFSGTLAIKADFDTGIESFVWVVQGESGRYRALRGGGLGSTVPTETGNINTYQGFLFH